MHKSSRHAKITGDFAEGLVLYWLSKYGYECARVDHVGIDLIARDPKTEELIGISVKSRSRYEGTQKECVNLPKVGFTKAQAACKAFGCTPYYAIVVDGNDAIRAFLISLQHLMKLAGDSGSDVCYWGMTERHLGIYRDDRRVKRFELLIQNCSWRDMERAGDMTGTPAHQYSRK